MKKKTVGADFLAIDICLKNVYLDKNPELVPSAPKPIKNCKRVRVSESVIRRTKL